ncbi:PIR protein [Plasmodium vivax]|nr:PIR protein [Plasmodium vivax]
MSKTDVEKLEKESKELGLNKAYDALFTGDGISKIDTECNVFKSGSKQHDGAKKLCSKLLYILENIAKNPRTPDNDKRCSYLPYWYYEQIRGIHNEHSKKISDISFIKELIDIRKKVYNKELKYTCEILYEKDVNLDEWKKRILSYIYFKNHDDIKKISISKNRTECDKRLKYVESFMPLYTEYYEKHCRNSGFFLFSSGGTDYFRCLSSYNPKDLLAALKKCEPPEPPKSRISASSAQVSGRAGGASQVSLAVTRGTTSLGGTRGLASPVTTARGAPVPGPVSTLQPGKSLPPPIGVITGQGPHAAVPSTLQIRNDTGHGPTAAVPSTLESASDKIDSNFIRDIIMGVAVIGTILFLFFYNMSSGLKFSSPIKKRNKKKMKHNYYEEYEKEFEKYGSEDMSLDSEEDRYYLNYQPEGEYDY